jgi:hypothetical protein
MDPDPAFYLNADPDPGSQTNADQDPDPDSDQLLKSQKVNLYMKNILKIGVRSKKKYVRRYKSLQETRFICKF